MLEVCLHVMSYNYSFEEAAQYLFTMKQYSTKDQKFLNHNTRKMGHNELALDSIQSIRGMNKNDAVKLLKKYGVRLI